MSDKACGNFKGLTTDGLGCLLPKGHDGDCSPYYKPPVILTEGDVYRFRYSQTERDKTAQGWAGSLDHCFDGTVVVRDGKLVDTYWDNSNQGRVVTPEQGTLTYVCNLGEVRQVKEYETLQFDEADVFDLRYNHGCIKRWMVRRDAKPSAKRMLEEVRKKRSAVEKELDSAINHAASTLFQLGELQARLEAGDLSRKPWWS